MKSEEREHLLTKILARRMPTVRLDHKGRGAVLVEGGSVLKTMERTCVEVNGGYTDDFKGPVVFIVWINCSSLIYKK